MPGFPTPKQLPDPPPAPRGWKIGTILPLHSPAYGSGGVSDNPFKEAMAEIQNMQGAGGMPGMPSFPSMTGDGPGEKKKDKKKGRA